MRKIIPSLFILLLAFTVTTEAQQRRTRVNTNVEAKEMVQKRQMMTKQRMQKKDRFQESLTEQQKEQIKEITLSSRKETISLQNQLAEKHARIRTLSTGDDYDEQALNKVIDEAAELRAEITKVQLATKHSIRETLTDDQKVLFDSRMQQAGKRKKMMKARSARRNK